MSAANPTTEESAGEATFAELRESYRTTNREFQLTKICNHIPRLGPEARDRDGQPTGTDLQASLLPGQGGIPGRIYLQVPVALCRQAELKQWKRLPDAARYTITGPDGSIDCELMYQGEPIPGAASTAGLRDLYIDSSIWHTTGHDKPPAPQPIDYTRPGFETAPADTDETVPKRDFDAIMKTQAGLIARLDELESAATEPKE